MSDVVYVADGTFHRSLGCAYPTMSGVDAVSPDDLDHLDVDPCKLCWQSAELPGGVGHV